MRRGSNGGATDLLVCFPSRAAHLALMPPPKSACSPSRLSASSEPVRRRRRSTSRAGGPPPSSTSSSALYMGASRYPSRRRAVVDVPANDDEPSSPKVTCAGQIKVRSPAKPAKCTGGAKAKKATWMQALGIKMDALPLLNALHGAFRLKVAGCFGAFPASAECTSGDDDDDDDDDGDDEKETDEHAAALTRWFMVLEEGKKVSRKKEEHEEGDDQEDPAPPANALMLMRCRSAPAKGLRRRLGGEAEEADEAPESTKMTMEEDNLVYMSYPPDFFQVSMDIAKETWIVGGGGDDAILRCRSWK